MPHSDLTRQLALLADAIKDVNTRLTRINNEWADPPEPDKPEIRAALRDIKTQAAITTRLTDGLLGRVG